ncbi:MAG: winged helix-turn-helix domain-containing protein [Nanoarchaeota archaeon]|nr:winged helix-turn-helix domain-containing protein [Nanoarchaeota archaeon]MBU1028363.1 winged helix-turn-helix domain-containing protein [Nanoarchaeota archaeon]
MNNEEVIRKQGKDPKFYLPIIKLLEKGPLSIKEVARFLNITYGAAKPRLHKLEKWGFTKRMKRGFYCLPETFENYSKISKIKGDLFFIKGCIRVMGSSNGVWITVYNSKFGEINNGKYCVVESFEKDKVIIRKSNKFAGSKLYLLKSKSVGISLSRKLISKNILKILSAKAMPVKIGIYLDEWDVSIGDLFSTESLEDGQLANELNKIGVVKKPSKFDNLKADIIFNYKNNKIPIEVTASKPSLDSNQPQHRMSSIKASQILMRFYFSIKWNHLHNLSTVLVLHKDWGNQDWVKKEREFMKNFNCYVIFTDFKGNWAHKSALEIKRSTESSLFNKTTLLRSS